MPETKLIWRGLLVAALLTAATLITSCGQTESSAATIKPASCDDANTPAGSDCSCVGTSCTVKVLCQQPPGQQSVYVPTRYIFTVRVTFKLADPNMTCRFKDFVIKEDNKEIYPAPTMNDQTFSAGDANNAPDVMVAYTYNGNTITNPHVFRYKTDSPGASPKGDGSGTIRNQ